MLIDQNLLNRLETVFIDDEQQTFIHHFQLYLNHNNTNIGFLINIDDVWNWLGISRKDNAKRILIKEFIQDVDYKIEHVSTDRRGGHNKENILMTPETFKSMCMMVNTEKGKATRRYYIKMEGLFLDYLHNKLNVTIETLQAKCVQLKLEKALDIERKLVDAHKKTMIVYVIRIDFNHDDEFSIKFGYTNDIETRLGAHRRDYKDCVLIDVFACNRALAFEQFILHHKSVEPHRVNNTELIKFSDKLPYKSFVKLIKKSIKRFDNYDATQRIEMMRLTYHQSILDRLAETHDAEERKTLLQLLQQKEEEHVVLDDDDMENIDPILTEKKEPIFSQRCVYKYEQDDLENPIAIYYSLRQAARSLNRPDIYDYHVRQASINNTILCGYRWFFTDQDQHAPLSIPPTEEPKKDTRRKGLIAQISEDKTHIVNVFANQRIAEKETKIPNCQINTGLSTGNIRHGFYWMMFDDCSEELKHTYTKELPKDVNVTKYAKRVERIDSETNEVLEYYKSMSEVCNAFKCCHKSIHIAHTSGDIFKGFKWRLVTSV